MSYQTNKYEVGTELSYKGMSYSILEGFRELPELTVDQYRSLSESDRQLRLNAFYAMLSDSLGVDIGSLILEGEEDRRFNAGSCPVNTYYRITPTANYGIAETREGKELYEENEPVNLVTVYDEEERVFEGWFVNDEHAYSQQEWSFLAVQDLSPEARYADSLYEITIDDREEKIISTTNTGGTYTVVISSDGDGWGVAEKPGWITLSVEEGEEGDTDVQVTIAPENMNREGVVYFYNKGNPDNIAVLRVIQQGAPIRISVSPMVEQVDGVETLYRHGVVVSISIPSGVEGNVYVNVDGFVRVGNRWSIPFSGGVSRTTTSIYLEVLEWDEALSMDVETVEVSPEEYNGRRVVYS